MFLSWKRMFFYMEEDVFRSEKGCLLLGRGCFFMFLYLEAIFLYQGSTVPLPAGDSERIFLYLEKVVSAPMSLVQAAGVWH
jgi:hypothetical protein